MSDGIALSRRSMLAGPILPPIVGGGAAGAATSGSSEIPVAYLSRIGNTSVIAGQIRRARGATLFEIRPATPYPEDYEGTVEQARRERQARP